LRGSGDEVTNSKEICGKIDAAHGERNIEECLKAVEKLAEMKVKSMMAGVDNERQKEIIEDCVIQIWQSEPKYEGRDGARFSTWVSAVIRNQIYSALPPPAKKDKDEEDTAAKKDSDEEDTAVRKLEIIEVSLDDIVGNDGEREGPQIKRDSAAIGSYPSPEAYEAFCLQSDGLGQKEIAEKIGRTYAATRKAISRWTEEMGKDAAREMVSDESGYRPCARSTPKVTIPY
jgi:DNA-directed RNA polymerase specialized sigma24 family protein